MTLNTDAPAVQPGQQVFLNYYDPKNTLVAVIATVVGVNVLDQQGIAEGGEPSLTVVFLPPNPDLRVLGSVKWQDAFVRLTGVLHVNHEAHDLGGVTAGWQEFEEEAILPCFLAERESTPDNPTYTRASDPEVRRISVGQAAAIQTGAVAPTPGTSPLLSETGIVEEEVAGSGSDRWGASDWTQAEGAGLTYPGAPLANAHSPAEQEVIATENVAEKEAVTGESPAVDAVPVTEASVVDPEANGIPPAA